MSSKHTIRQQLHNSRESNAMLRQRIDDLVRENESLKRQRDNYRRENRLLRDVLPVDTLPMSQEPKKDD